MSFLGVVFLIWLGFQFHKPVRIGRILVGILVLVVGVLAVLAVAA